MKCYFCNKDESEVKAAIIESIDLNKSVRIDKLKQHYKNQKSKYDEAVKEKDLIQEYILSFSKEEIEIIKHNPDFFDGEKRNKIDKIYTFLKKHLRSVDKSIGIDDLFNKISLSVPDKVSNEYNPKEKEMIEEIENLNIMTKMTIDIGGKIGRISVPFCLICSKHHQRILSQIQPF